MYVVKFQYLLFTTLMLLLGQGSYLRHWCGMHMSTEQLRFPADLPVVKKNHLHSVVFFIYKVYFNGPTFGV